jgi:hypothetical protein
MKTLIFLLTLIVNISAFAQYPCEMGEIPPVNKIKCVAEKAYLYDIFPKLTSYKGFLFEAISYCNYAHLDANKTQLRFDYCISENQKMTVTITDLEHSFYKTDVGKPQKEAILMIFKPEMINPYLQNYQSTNKSFDTCVVHMPKVTNGKPYVTFEAYQNKRFWVHIVIDGGQFKTSKEVDAFINEYTKAFSFAKK